MAVCIDASVIIPFLLPLASTGAVDRFWDDASANQQLVAPPLLFAEVTSVTRRHVHMAMVSPERAVTALQRLFQLPVSMIHHPDMYLLALEFARRLGHARAYDVQYLAVAQMEDCPVATLDRGLHESARTLGTATRLIA